MGEQEESYAILSSLQKQFPEDSKISDLLRQLKANLEASAGKTRVTTSGDFTFVSSEKLPVEKLDFIAGTFTRASNTVSRAFGKSEKNIKVTISSFSGVQAAAMFNRMNGEILWIKK